MKQPSNLKQCWYDNPNHMTYEELLIETALKDERIIVMTAENRALVRNAPKALGQRFIDTGITEQTMVGMAAGLALRGRIPIVHALAPFLTMRAFEFIRTDVGIAHLPVKLSGYIPGVLSDGNGPTHQAIEDVSIMRGIPGMEVYSPADEDDLVKMLPFIWSGSAPAYVRINHKKGQYTHEAYAPGKAEIIAEGKDVTLLVYGYLFDQARQARMLLEKEGLSVGLINMRSLKPVDEAAIIRAALSSRLLVTIEDHLRTGGLYSIVAEAMLRHRVGKAEVLPLSLEERWFRPGLLSEVLETEEFTPEQITSKILSNLSILLYA
jgi:transketolase